MPLFTSPHLLRRRPPLRVLPLLLLFLALTLATSWVPSSFAFEYGEHKDLGDEAFRAVARRLVSEGYFPSTLALKEVVEKQFHMRCVQEEKICYYEKLSHLPNEVTYGTLNALSGDHSENPLVLEEDLQNRSSVMNQTIALQMEYFDRFRNGAPNIELFDLDTWYGLLAYVNLSHFYDYGRSFEEHLEDFDPDHVRMLWRPKDVRKVFDEINTHLIDKYLTLHAFAISLAERAGSENRGGAPEKGSVYLYYAILFNAFADHFLEDMFAAGHLVVKRTVGATLINNNSLHSFYNEAGVRVGNLRGEIWKTYGDNNLNKPDREWESAEDYLAIEPIAKESQGEDFFIERPTKPTLKYRKAVLAVSESLWEVWSAFEKARKADTTSLLEKLPPKKTRIVDEAVQKVKTVPVLSMIPMPEEKKDDRPMALIRLFPVLSMIPIPFGTTDLESLDVPREEIPSLLKVTQLIPNREFVRTRVANTLMFLWGGNFSENATGMLGARLGVGGFYYSYQDVEDKTGTVDHWLGGTVSYIAGNFSQRSGPFFNRVKLGPEYLVDFWVSPKRYFGVYSYLESGMDIRAREVHFLFAPSLGLQLGPLVGWDNYALPEYLSLPLQLILPVKGAVTFNIVDGLEPEFSYAIEVDVLF